MKNFFSSNRLVFQNAGGPGETPKAPSEGQKKPGNLPVEAPKPAEWKKKGEDMTKKEVEKLSAQERKETRGQMLHQIRDWFAHADDKPFENEENRTKLIAFLKSERGNMPVIDYQVPALRELGVEDPRLKGPENNAKYGKVLENGVRVVYNSAADSLVVSPFGGQRVSES